MSTNYQEVPPEEYAGFLAGESKGIYFNCMGIYFNCIFKPRGYRYIRLK